MKDKNQSLVTVIEIRQRPVTIAEFRQAGLGGFWPDSSGFNQIRPASDHGWILAGIWSADFDDSDWMSPNSDANRFSVARYCRISTLARFRRLTIARFRKSDIKRACKDKEFNSKP